MSGILEAGDEGMKNIPAKQHVIPASAIRGIATGLLMMAFFTGLWSGIAFGGLQSSILRFTLIIFLILIILFVFTGIRFFRIAKLFPESLSAEDVAERKKMGKWFGIIFGVEGLGIFLAVNIVINLGHPDLIIPAIALVVGLHFYPMAKIFKRKIDYWLATWATLIAVCGIIFALNKTLPSQDVLTFVGVGIALATSSYGIYMISEGNRLIKVNGLNPSFKPV
jgi:MFS family permease